VAILPRLLTILFTLQAVNVGLPLSFAQQQTKVFSIGFLISNSRSSEATRIQAFLQGLRERGYVEGRSVVIEYRYGDGNYARLPDLAADLVQRNVDVIVTSGTPSTRAAQQATKTIPIVMTVVGSPISFVNNLANPGGNITGLTQISQDLTGKRLELLKEAFPKIFRVAHFVNTTGTAEENHRRIQERQVLAEALGLKLLFLEMRDPSPDFERALRTLANERVDALMVGPGPLVNLDRKYLVDLVTKTRLPAIYSAADFVEAGGLMSYASDFIDLYKSAAVYVDKILRGAKPADLPVEQPAKFEFVVNLKTAKQMGLTIPPQVLMDADRVIK
jgi:putative tryptophan/tyrosine transport system substrate-binding protein